MEIELKYTILDDGTEQAIWENELFEQFEEENSREEIYLHAKYFDTDNCDLAKNEIAYRVRMEGSGPVAALKWKGHSEDGLHVREEINVPVDTDEANPEVFRESSVGKEVMALLKDRELRCFIETRIYRKRLRIDTGDGIYELSIDKGDILTQYGSIPVAEVELELFSGETEGLIKIGEQVQNRYNLSPEDKSKYARGIEMIKRCR